MTAESPIRQLRRELGIRDLVIYGLVLIQPIAPVGIYGLASKMAGGHVATTILVAMVAMSLTAYSYGRMAALYPSAGSAYTYVGKGLGAHLGFLAGWAMFLDYLIIPIVSLVYCALTLQRLLPAVPFPVWAVALTVVVSALNLRGISATAKLNAALLYVMSAVIVIFVALSVAFLFRRGGLSGVFSTLPFYDPRTFEWHSVATATSLAALTYIGFDGVTTLAEEVRQPERSVPFATVLVCLLTGVFSVIEVYLAAMVWPDFRTYPNPETAFLDVTRVVGGNPLFQAMGVVLIVACLGSGLTGQAGLARLLFSMGRDGVLPRRWFAHLNPKRNIPSYNVLLTGALTIVGVLFIPYETAAELLNFGAFLAFMGVNGAAMLEYWIRRPSGSRRFMDLVLPGCGFLFCLLIWLSLPSTAKIAGGGWFLLGLAYLAFRTKGFRQMLAFGDFPVA